MLRVNNNILKYLNTIVFCRHKPFAFIYVPTYESIVNSDDDTFTVVDDLNLMYDIFIDEITP